MDTLKEGFEGEKKPKYKVILWITLLYTFTWVYVSDKYSHWPRVSVQIIIIHANNVSVNLRSLDMIYTYMGFAHHIYMVMDTYTHNLGLNEPLVKQIHITHIFFLFLIRKPY
jgi:hypothetical protein